MATFRAALPQLDDRVFLTDSGLETDLIFNHGLEIPEFASFVLLDDDKGRAALRTYFDQHVEVARAAGTGVVLETATWRANPDWAAKLGYDAAALADVQRRAVQQLVEVRADNPDVPIVISGVLGPRGDGYQVSDAMSADEAERYHSAQLHTFATTEADLAHAMTMTYAAEAIGIVRAARAAEIPIVISFTVETDGTLPDGSSLGAAIEEVDAATDGGAAYFGVNCAHPSHFAHVLAATDVWVGRLRSVRANASRMSHAELDEAETLDAGDPVELGADYAALRAQVPGLTVLGGCCGTDARHVAAIARACV